MVSYTCGPLCQHPTCWTIRSKSGTPNDENLKLDSPEVSKYYVKSEVNDIPTLKVSSLGTDALERHKSLPPLRPSIRAPQTTPASQFHLFKPKKCEPPRVSHIIVQAGFQCNPQKKWVWLPSIHSGMQLQKASASLGHKLKDMTNDLIQSRPNSSRLYPVDRSHHHKSVQSRSKQSSYLDIVRRNNFLNLLEMPEELQIILLENPQFRQVLSLHPIDHIPETSLPESVLVELSQFAVPYRLSNFLGFDGVGIFFDPPDDLTCKHEPYDTSLYQPKKVMLPRRRSDGPEPSTYVRKPKKMQPTDLPLPLAIPVPPPSFREYVMRKRAESGADSLRKVIEVPRPDTDSLREDNSSPLTKHTLELARSPLHAVEADDEEGMDPLLERTKVTAEHIHIPSGEDAELAAIVGSTPPTRDSWRYTSFSTVTPFSEAPLSVAEKHNEKSVKLYGEPLNEIRTDSELNDRHMIIHVDKHVVIPPPTCTPTDELE